ncbi:MAG: sugar phosphate isomerase/epimerase [Verrucomicrobia bacterium]|jgi:sugar phosphate isomerase/epimerase|nr:sugar phosphate isomerase/epimerase [Verrucomicrobiota bacterium]
MYSLSTCWNAHRHTDGRALLGEIRGLGFEYAELSHGIRVSLVPGIVQAVGAGEMRISSLHNFCPLPLGVDRPSPNLYQCSCPSRREVEFCWKHTLKTLELAERLQAPVVVLHLGSVEMKSYTDKLLDLIEHGQQNEPKYQRLCAEADEKRESKKEGYWERSLQFLERLVPEAQKRGLRLGVENREALEELPFDADFPALFEKFAPPTVVYWHDFGHAQIKEHLGFISHARQLESMQDRLGGLHIHDVVFPARDHRAPGSGTVDFESLGAFVKPEVLKVFEFSPRLTLEEIRAGVQHVRTHWGARQPSQR